MRTVHPARQNFKVELLLESFSPDLQREWAKVELLALLAFMYHSSIDIEGLAVKCEEATVMASERP